MIHCPVCASGLEATRLVCGHCRVGLEGRFQAPRLARLSAEQQQFTEQLVLCGGNLKELAGAMEVSYPTLRKRLDGLIDALKELRQADQSRIDTILGQIETKNIPPEQGLREIREINGEL